MWDPTPGPAADRLVVIDAVRSLAQRLFRKSLGFALRRPVEEKISSLMMEPLSDSGPT
jgi:hypothetical protein